MDYNNTGLLAIVIEKTIATLCGVDGGPEYRIDVHRGTLVDIKEAVNNYCKVMIVDYYQKNLAFENNLYMMKYSTLLEVTNDVWPYLVAISDPHERANVAKDREFIEYFQTLREQSFVAINGQFFSIYPMKQSLQFLPEREPKNRALDYDCIIRYMGPVGEIGPGFYIGLELLNLVKGHSPQEKEIEKFSFKYINCKADLAFILPVNFLKKPSLPKKNNKSTFSSILCGIKDKVKSHSNRHSYIDNSVTDSASEYSSASTKRSLTPELVNYNTINTNYGKMNASNKFPSSISSPNLSKQDSGSSTTSSSQNRFNNLDSNNLSEDYSQIVAERERKMEERRMSGSRSIQTPSTSSANGEARTPKSKKKTVLIPSAPNRDIRPSTILRLEDRDLIVIDKQDIKEAVRNESDVIIVDPPTLPQTPSDNDHADLTDILGGAWPDLAGASGTLLNNDRKSGSINNGYRSIERNKSPNIASHFTNSRPRYDSHNGYRKKQNGQYDNFDQDSVSSVDQISDCIVPSPLFDIPNSSLEIGTVVEVAIEGGKNLHGVIRWIGHKYQEDALKMSNGYNNNNNSSELVVGVELDEPCNERGLRLTDGIYNGQRCFRCPDRRAIFVSPKQCTKDRRFLEEGTSKASTIRSNTPSDGKAFGADCPIIEGSVSALTFENYDDLDAHCGKFKGIQGHHNSCYLDATLFAMFTFTSVFDSILFRPRDSDDHEQYEEVQRVLREEIVNPLRKNLFVRADRVLKLRKLLDKLTSVKGLMNEEKDPEEFLNSLLAQTLRAEPFLKLSSGQDAYFYQLFLEKDEKLSLPTVQQLFEQSFLTSDVKLKEVPSCLIIQMPRYGKNFKMYPRILPSQVLDVTDIIEDSPRQCTICGALAEFECKECFGVLQTGSGLESTAFCQKCLTTAHSHHKRKDHTPKAISIPHDFKIISDYNPVPRLFMELFAVICIETSHYVAFVKAGSGSDSPWVFFDSMADRKGEQNGYNIPEMISVPNLPTWLSEEGARNLHEANLQDKHLPVFAKRLLCDASLMLYQSQEMMMYR
ncbi:uncharacterized protein CYLD [Chironomus tepperi]|uniref:uncharacterized protein CYLD n=1 Tax=Chironomus tepperi TaxID=113505 RepID=UPI00391F52A6